MTGRKRIVLFGDAIGLPLGLKILSEQDLDVILVYDPSRRCADNRHLKQLPKTATIIPNPQKAEREIFVGRLEKMKPDLGIIFSYSRILWAELINIFPMGVINIHNGKLPEYRGANVLQWAIINGESKTAVTMHYVDLGIDSGPIITSVPITISHADTALSLREKMLDATESLLLNWLPEILNGEVVTTLQDESKAVRWPRRFVEHGRFDWSWADEQIYNLIRALVPPWPGAYFYDATGKKIVIKNVLSFEEIAALRKDQMDDSTGVINSYANLELDIK